MSLLRTKPDTDSGTFYGRCILRLRGSGGFIRSVLAFATLVLLPAAGILVAWATFDLIFARHPTDQITNGVIQSSGFLAFFSLYITAAGVVIAAATRLAERLGASLSTARTVACVTSLLVCGYLFVGLAWMSNMHLGLFLLLVGLSVFAAYAIIPGNPARSTGRP
jgi:hypothetical protein